MLSLPHSTWFSRSIHNGPVPWQSILCFALFRLPVDENSPFNNRGFGLLPVDVHFDEVSPRVEIRGLDTADHSRTTPCPSLGRWVQNLSSTKKRSSVSLSASPPLSLAPLCELLNATPKQYRRMSMNSGCGLPGDFGESRLGMDSLGHGYYVVMPLPAQMNANTIVTENGHSLLDNGPRPTGVSWTSNRGVFDRLGNR